MKFYFNYMKNVCRQGLVYRFNYIVQSLGGIIALVVQYYIWKALLVQDISNVDTVNADFQYMATYITISAVIRACVKSGTIGEINQRIRNGSIAMDLIKPYSFLSLMFCRKIAKVVYQFVSFSVPLLLFASVFMHFKLAGLWNVFFGLFATCGGILIMFLIEYILGLLGFWFQQVWVLERFLNDFIRFISGAVLPLWVFPESIQVVSVYLPFRYIYYEPITVFTNDFGSNQILKLMIVQGGWIISLFALSIFLWKKSIKKIVIQGG